MQRNLDFNKDFDKVDYFGVDLLPQVGDITYYYGGYYNDKEFVRMDKKIQNSSPISSTSIYFTLQATGKGKGKTLAESIKIQAIKKMKVTEISDLDVKNTDFKGMYILKNKDLLVYIRYIQDEDDEKSKPTIGLAVVNTNHDTSFDKLAKELAKDFND